MFSNLGNIFFFLEEQLLIWKYKLKVIQILKYSYFFYAVICGVVNIC